MFFYVRNCITIIIISIFCFRIMATNLEAKIKFETLCVIFENIFETHASRKKISILQTFIDDCRNIANRLKLEHPESVCIIHIILLCNILQRKKSYNLIQNCVYSSIYNLHLKKIVIILTFEKCGYC